MNKASQEWIEKTKSCHSDSHTVHSQRAHKILHDDRDNGWRGGWVYLVNSTSTFWLGILFAHVGGGFFYMIASAAQGIVGAATERTTIRSACTGEWSVFCVQYSCSRAGSEVIPMGAGPAAKQQRFPRGWGRPRTRFKSCSQSSVT